MYFCIIMFFRLLFSSPEKNINRKTCGFECKTKRAASRQPPCEVDKRRNHLDQKIPSSHWFVPGLRICPLFCCPRFTTRLKWPQGRCWPFLLFFFFFGKLKLAKKGRMSCRQSHALLNFSPLSHVSLLLSSPLSLSLYLSLSFPPSLSTILSLVSSMSSLLYTFLPLSFAFYLSFSSSSMSLSQMSFVSALPASLPLSPFLSFCVSVCLMSPNLLASFPNG